VSHDSDMLRVLRSSFQSAKCHETAMDPFEKNRLLPVEIMITVAVNIVTVTLGYYVVILWGVFGG
jgi:hypothetical protein